MRKIGFLPVALVLAFLFSCESTDLKCIRASDTIITETRPLIDYSGVVFNNVGKVLIIQGPEYRFKITGPDNVVELTTTEVENNLLVIGSDACFNGSYELNVEITAPEWKRINLSGVGDITSVGKLSADVMTVEMIGVGKIIAQIEANQLITTIAGTGDVSLSGTVSKHELTCAGEFELDAYDLLTEQTIIDVTGTGDSYVTASDMLDVMIEGAGNVYYKGTPTVKSQILGTGSVIDSN
jgi:hypothetical protein